MVNSVMPPGLNSSVALKFVASIVDVLFDFNMLTWSNNEVYYCHVANI